MMQNTKKVLCTSLTDPMYGELIYTCKMMAFFFRFSLPVIFPGCNLKILPCLAEIIRFEHGKMYKLTEPG